MNLHELSCVDSPFILFMKEYKGVQLMGRKLTPIKAIRAKCMDCCCGDSKEVAICTVIDCPLHIYRMGTRNAEATLEKRKNRKRTDFTQDTLDKTEE